MPSKIKSLIILFLLIFLGVLFKDRLITPEQEIAKPQIPSSKIYGGVGYVAVNPNDFEISILAKDLAAPTRLKITPDGEYLLVTQITGEVLAFKRMGAGWENSPLLITKVNTKFPGFPPDEAGLVGMVFSKDYLKNGKLFLLYTYKDKDGKTKNRISESVLRERNGNLTGSKPKLIYEANIAGNPSHQITDAINVDVEGKPHLLFLIGEGFDAKRAQDPSLEAGKLILIQEDGSRPLGTRPYPQNPKIQALGIRNGYVLAKNPLDSEGRIALTDTGPDHYDRVIYTNPFRKNSLNFGWDGDESKLKNPIPDPNFPNVSDMVIYRLPDTRTFTGFSFYRNGEILATLFGKTGSKENSPGKEILLGHLTNLNGQPKIIFQTIVKRNPKAEGKFGNPIGLEIDPKTQDFFFADVMEGKVYRVHAKGGDKK